MTAAVNLIGKAIKSNRLISPVADLTPEALKAAVSHHLRHLKAKRSRESWTINQAKEIKCDTDC